MFHYSKNHKRYLAFPKPTACDFCNLTSHERVLEETKFHYIVPNRLFYDVWELRRVTDHLLVIPKRHVHSLNELSDDEKLDHISIAARYEEGSYNVYARAANSKQRSVSHQHTHLIKTVSRRFRGSFLLSKPYIFITFGLSKKR